MSSALEKKMEAFLFVHFSDDPVEISEVWAEL